MLAEDVKLFRRQLVPPFLIVLWDVHPANLPDSIDSEGMRIAAPSRGCSIEIGVTREHGRCDRRRDLVKTFSRRGQPEVRAVDGLTFAVRRGSIFGLLGPNGAGKTTTLQDAHDAAPTDVRHAPRRRFRRREQPLEVRRRIAVVIQEQAAELFLSVRDNLATFGRFHGLSRDADSRSDRRRARSVRAAPEADAQGAWT